MMKLFQIGCAFLLVIGAGNAALADGKSGSSDKSAENQKQAEEKNQRTIDEQMREKLGYINRHVELNDDQKQAMLEIVAKREAELKSWDEANRKRFRDFREQHRDARKDGDGDAVKQVREDAMKLWRERRGIQTEYGEKVMQVMDQAQRTGYRTALLRRSVERYMRGFQMNEEQKQKLDELLEAGAQKIGEAEPGKRWDLVRSETQAIVKTMKASMTAEQVAAAEKARDERRAEWQKRREAYRDRHRQRGEGNGDRGKKSSEGGEEKAAPKKSPKPATPSNSGGGVEF